MMEDNNRNFNLWKILVVLAHRKVFIVSFVLVCTLAAVTVALVLPKWYRAKSSILPSQYDQNIGLSGNFAQYTMTSAGFDLPIMATPSDVYATMLKSETIGRAVIGELNLLDYYHEPSVQKCLLYLKDKLKITVTGEGVIELYFQDKNPEMAAKVANAYIKQLDILNREVKSSKARSDREFIYQRLQTTKNMLDSAQARLLAFQKENKALDLERQRDLALDAAAGLKSQLALKSVELDVKKRVYSADHPEIQRLEVEVNELKRQLSGLEHGNGNDSYLNMPLVEIPRLTAEYADLKSDVEIQEKVYVLLTELYEEAQIKEQKDTPTIAILETAYPPEIRYKPMRSLIVIAAFLGSLALAIFISLFADYLENLRRTSPSDFELMDRARKNFTGRTGYGDS
jgi:tyrosine-protein kinase Etk/Wzc